MGSQRVGHCWATFTFRTALRQGAWEVVDKVSQEMKQESELDERMRTRESWQAMESLQQGPGHVCLWIPASGIVNAHQYILNLWCMKEMDERIYIYHECTHTHGHTHTENWGGGRLYTRTLGSSLDKTHHYYSSLLILVSDGYFFASFALTL